ncbi:MAG: hypothetical protein JWM90_1634 [Thermoleophilia bacterium]|nr:hypothetical protein [Thermoleophilia bacterium]
MIPRRLPLRALLLCAVALVVPVSTASAAEVLTVTAPATDNYKAQWNANPQVRELRSWLSFDVIGAAGTTWKPVAPGDIVVTGGSVTVNAADGRSARLSARVIQGAATVLLRYDHAARGAKFGPLISLTNPDTLAVNPVRVQLTLTSNDVNFATGIAEYRDEAAFDSLPSDHLEYNGPGGRWHVGGSAIRTDWEAKPASPLTLTASTPSAPATVRPPRITSLWMPLRVRTPRVTVSIRGAAVGASRIKYARIQVGAGRWSRWTPIRSSYTVRLRSANATTRVRVQLRNAAGQNSLIAQRYVRCVCG